MRCVGEDGAPGGMSLNHPVLIQHASLDPAGVLVGGWVFD
jgi:hypothetical protein